MNLPKVISNVFFLFQVDSVNLYVTPIRTLAILDLRNPSIMAYN